jgi:hypothetical protein
MRSIKTLSLTLLLTCAVPMLAGQSVSITSVNEPMMSNAVITATKAQPVAATRGNATISGLSRTPLAMDIRRASLNGKVATIALKAGTVSETLGAALMQASAKGTVIPVVTIESAGQQWAFTKVLITSVAYSQSQDTIFTFQFETMNGSAAAFQALGN